MVSASAYEPTYHEPRGAHQGGKAAASGWIGSALEYYDFFIYATAASLMFPQIFFPSENPTVAIVASLATYGVGYVARPIGAFVPRPLGRHARSKDGSARVHVPDGSLDHGGRPAADLSAGRPPRAGAAGRFCGLVQGFAVAGEISGASSMILEHAPFGRRGFFAQLQPAGRAGRSDPGCGRFPAACAVHARSDASTPGAGAFRSSLSVVVIIAGYIIRREVAETPAFTAENSGGELPKAPIVEAFRVSWRDMLRVVCMSLMNVIPVVATIFGAAYAVQPAYGVGLAKDIYLWIPVLGNIIAVAVIPYVGNLSDRIGRRPPIIVGATRLRPAVVRVSLRDQHPQRSPGDRLFPVDVGDRLSGLQRRVPELLSRIVPTSTGFRRWRSRKTSAPRSRRCCRRCSPRSLLPVRPMSR